MNTFKTRLYAASEYKVVSLRECPCPEDMAMCDTPEKAQAYWMAHVQTAPSFNPEVENMVVLMLNTKMRIKGHYVVSIGTLNSTMISPREVFRAAIVSAAYAIVLMHNHPSGDATPSNEDIKATRGLVEAGNVLGIRVIDHVIVGYERHASLKDLCYL